MNVKGFFKPKGNPTDILKQGMRGPYQRSLENLTYKLEQSHRIIIVLIVCLVIAILSIVFISLTANYKTYVVRVDSLTGQIEAAQELKATNYSPRDAEIKYFLTSLVVDTRTIGLDPVAYKQNWMKAQYFLTPSAAQKLNSMVAKENPVQPGLKFLFLTLRFQMLVCCQCFLLIFLESKYLIRYLFLKSNYNFRFEGHKRFAMS